jgi:hypothetical protein
MKSSKGQLEFLSNTYSLSLFFSPSLSLNIARLFPFFYFPQNLTPPSVDTCTVLRFNSPEETSGKSQPFEHTFFPKSPLK